jgi:hypothetical protein
MFRLAFDTASVTAVGIFSGRENVDADYRAYIDSIHSLDNIATQQRHTRGVYALIIDPENPPPNAMWRRRIADSSAHLQSNPLVSVITNSIVIRGVVTAVNWIRPPLYVIKCHESIEISAEWIREQRGTDVLALMRRLERECRGTGTGRLAKTI